MYYFNCSVHGGSNTKCCVRAQEIKRDYRTLGSVPWRNRVEVRHTLQEVHSMALESRAAMIHEELNADGALRDLDDMIGKLEHCKRELS